ncbi:MAG TPA: M17 family peptidase N-terminal domain-containing protein [Candidatus Acidoferrum sp.]|nr:M17 family peptidase N-terminal domain-containing protein [Candidatus Methylomirabilis sp.]HWU39272.1 M17 family peptidase N-terminal domain-containing protein [Candidatus Acidoferrum sp.]
MQIAESDQPIQDIEADILLLFHLQDELAPRGRLGQVDWILCGAVSRLRARGKFAGERGASALLVPNGKLKATRILVIGLGRQADLTVVSLYRSAYQAAQAILNLRCTHLAMEPPYRAFPAEAPASVQQTFIEGFLAELRRGQSGAPFVLTLLSTSSDH